MNNRLLSGLLDLPRPWKLALLVSFDLVTMSFALWAAFSLRFGAWNPPNSVTDFALIAIAPLVAIPIFFRLGVYKGVVRFLPERAIWRIVQATTLAVLTWIMLVFLSQLGSRFVVPRSVPVLYWAIATMMIGGSRFLAKRLLWRNSFGRVQSPTILIYGAGASGAHLVNALRREGNLRVIGFLDDDASIHGREVAGVPVYSPASYQNLVGQFGVKEIILSIPTLSTARRQEIVTTFSKAGLRVRTVPPISELVSGKYLISHIREIDIDELLGRSSVPADQKLLTQMIKGRTIMVTGAGGSIGSALCRLIVGEAPQSLVLLESSEFALYEIGRELAKLGDCAIVSVLASVSDSATVGEAIKEHAVTTVFHAAAYKHVPLVEQNALVGIQNNVFGTSAVATAAFEAGVKNFVLISSDKAVRPTNVMGATKRWAEFIVNQKAREAAASRSGQLFCAVRFGNVLGSNGSVVPLFKEQIARGGPVTLTDAAMTRYFMSIYEAAELIVQAGALSEGGDVFLLNMGAPVLIKDLAENMIALAGLTVKEAQNPHGDIEIVATGKRPGEKMYEELFYDETSARPTLHPKIMRALSSELEGRDIYAALDQLATAIAGRDEAAARQVLFDFIQ